MLLEILTPEKTIFSGDIYGVQLPGVKGSFAILQHHAPMVAALGSGKLTIMKHKNDHASEIWEISGGFVETLDNKTTILLECATMV